MAILWAIHTLMVIFLYDELPSIQDENSSMNNENIANDHYFLETIEPRTDSSIDDQSDNENVRKEVTKPITFSEITKGLFKSILYCLVKNRLSSCHKLYLGIQKDQMNLVTRLSFSTLYPWNCNLRIFNHSKFQNFFSVSKIFLCWLSWQSFFLATF